MCEDIRNCCRICLDVESDHVPILGDPTIHLHMKSCLSVTICPNDDLPKMICTSCVSQLTEFYNFQLNARCSQDWLESSILEKSKKNTEKAQIQPLPDSEYNSDSLLEFLNNTANIEEYLNNLGKEDIPSIVNLFDRNENALEINKSTSKNKVPTPKKKVTNKSKECINMEIDVLDSDIEIVKEILTKGTDPKMKSEKDIDKNYVCFACKIKLDDIHKLLQHISTCDIAIRTCKYCNILFDSKQKMLEHSIIHTSNLTCYCNKQFESSEELFKHYKICNTDYGATLGFIYRCKQCGETFKERFLLLKHAREHVHKSEERVCDICGHTFNGNDALTKHRLEEHEKPTSDHMYRCKVCQFTSTDRKSIYLHVKKHTTLPEPRRHLCECCGRSFVSRASLFRHTSQHEKLKGYKCALCDKRFANIKLRDDHVSEHVHFTICDRCGQNVKGFNLENHKCIL